MAEPGAAPPILADHLTLSQPWGADYAHHYSPPQIFRPSAIPAK